MTIKTVSRLWPLVSTLEYFILDYFSRLALLPLPFNIIGNPPTLTPIFTSMFRVFLYFFPLIPIHSLLGLIVIRLFHQKKFIPIYYLLGLVVNFPLYYVILKFSTIFTLSFSNLTYANQLLPLVINLTANLVNRKFFPSDDLSWSEKIQFDSYAQFTSYIVAMFIAVPVILILSILS